MWLRQMECDPRLWILILRCFCFCPHTLPYSDDLDKGIQFHEAGVKNRVILLRLFFLKTLCFPGQNKIHSILKVEIVLNFPCWYIVTWPNLEADRGPTASLVITGNAKLIPVNINSDVL